MADELKGAVVAERVEGPKPDEVAALKDAVAKLTALVQAQQEEREIQKDALERLAAQGMRPSDLQTVASPDLAALVEMTSEGFRVRLRGNWTMGHINQVRMAMRRQMMVDAANASRVRRQEEKKYQPREQGLKIAGVDAGAELQFPGTV